MSGTSFNTRPKKNSRPSKWKKFETKARGTQNPNGNHSNGGKIRCSGHAVTTAEKTVVKKEKGDGNPRVNCRIELHLGKNRVFQEKKEGGAPGERAELIR